MRQEEGKFEKQERMEKRKESMKKGRRKRS